MPIIGDVIEVRDSRSQTIDFGSTKAEVRKFMVFDLQDAALDTLAQVKNVYKGAPHPDNANATQENEKLFCTHLDTTFVGSGAVAKEFGGIFLTMVTAYYQWTPLDPYQVAWYGDFQPRTVIEQIDKDRELVGGVMRDIPIGAIDPETGQVEGVPAFRGGGTMMGVWRTIGQTASDAQEELLWSAYGKCNDDTYLKFGKGNLLLYSFSYTPMDGQEWEFRATLLVGDTTGVGSPWNADDQDTVGHREWKRYFKVSKINESTTIVELEKERLHRVYDFTSFKSVFPGKTK